MNYPKASEVIKMTNNSYANQCIKCTVASCKNHCNDKDYCSLEEVKIGTHEPHPTQCQCVDCKSFELK